MFLLIVIWEVVFILPEVNPYSPGIPSLESSPQTVFLDVTVCPVSFQLRLPLIAKPWLKGRVSGAGPLVSAGLGMSSLCWLDGFHVSSHNLFRCCTATLPHHIPVMSTKWRGSPKRHHTGLRGVETWGSQYTYITHSAFNCPYIVPPEVFTVQARRLPRFSPRVHCHSSPPHPCDEY